VSSRFRAAARAVSRRLRVPAGTRCSRCRQSDPLALLRETSPLLCVDCDALAQGLAWFELHHPIGDANDPATIALRPSTHRYFTERQRGWHSVTLSNPRGSARLRQAAALRALADIHAFVCDRVALPIARSLERRHLRDCVGAHA
jgi:hypothetical protein